MRKNEKKKAKTAKVTEVKSFASYNHYTCPSCKTHVTDFTLRKIVLRIRCSTCGQEIILKW